MPHPAVPAAAAALLLAASAVHAFVSSGSVGRVQPRTRAFFPALSAAGGDDFWSEYDPGQSSDIDLFDDPPPPPPPPRDARRVPTTRGNIDEDMSSTEDDAPGSILSESSAFNSACGSDSVKAHSTKIQEECKTEVPQRENLQWEFSGLTIWVELEEFENDITKAIEGMAEIHGTEVIPQGHMTAIYGMDHLGVEEAKKRLRSVPNKIRAWPKFKKPVGVVQDVAVAGNPGQVCSIAWAQLTLSSDPAHEEAMDLLYDIFYGPSSEKKASRDRPWTPHYSIGYDNPEGTPMTLGATLEVISKLPTLTTCERHAKALSLWSTEGKMGDWECLDRINFF